MLAVAGRSCPSPRLRIVGAKQVQKVRLPQAGRTIGRAVFVNQQRKCDAGFVAELAGVVAIAESDGGQRRSTRFELALVFAQLRDMLAAENSAIVAQEDDHSRAILPQGAQPDGMVVCIGQRDFG